VDLNRQLTAQKKPAGLSAGFFFAITAEAQSPCVITADLRAAGDF
jgi:hypothetical protein